MKPTYRYNPRLLAKGEDTSFYAIDEDDDGRVSSYIVAMHRAPTATPEQEQDFERLELDKILPETTAGMHPLVFNRPLHQGGLSDEMLVAILMHRASGMRNRVERIGNPTITGFADDYFVNLEAALDSLHQLANAAAALVASREKAAAGAAAQAKKPGPTTNAAGDNPKDDELFNEFLNRAFKAN